MSLLILVYVPTFSMDYSCLSSSISRATRLMSSLGRETCCCYFVGPSDTLHCTSATLRRTKRSMSKGMRTLGRQVTMRIVQVGLKRYGQLCRSVVRAAQGRIRLLIDRMGVVRVYLRTTGGEGCCSFQGQTLREVHHLGRGKDRLAKHSGRHVRHTLITFQLAMTSCLVHVVRPSGTEGMLSRASLGNFVHRSGTLLAHFFLLGTVMRVTSLGRSSETRMLGIFSKLLSTHSLTGHCNLICCRT